MKHYLTPPTPVSIQWRGGSLSIIAMLLFSLTCSKAKSSDYQPVYDPSLPGSAAQAECTNAQDAAAIPSVTYTTTLTTFGVTVQNLAMGAVNSGGATTNFRFYAPAANSVEVLTYAASSTAYDAPTTVTAMTRDVQSGVYYANGVTAGVGTFYRYRVNCMKTYLGGSPIKEFQRYIPDPYARAQVGSSGHSIVMNNQDSYVWGGGETTWFVTAGGSRQKTKD